MPIETVSFFFGLLSILALGLMATSLVGLTTGNRFTLAAHLQPVGREVAAVVAVTAVAGSLYLSEIANFRPCTMCWIQRGFMYPAALILVAAALSRKRILAVGGAALAALGLPVALYHRYEQFTGEQGTLCDADNPCSARWLNEFGVLTIPTMAAIAFATIVVLVWHSTRSAD